MSGKWRRSTPSRMSRLPSNWYSTIVPAVKARDQGICYKCKLPTGTEVDHKDPGDDHRMENLGLICTPCHRAKTSAEGTAAMRVRVQSRYAPVERHPGLL